MVPDVLLLSLPWAPLLEPSLGLGILKAKLQEDGIACRVCHLNIFLLKYLKEETYERVGSLTGLNDFMFSAGLDSEPLAAEQLEQLRRLAGSTRKIGPTGQTPADPSPFVDYALRIRTEVIPKFLADCMRVIDESPATMVGFTCMYDQTIASLALARLIKEKYPEKLLVCGGYALEKPNGPQIIRCFPFIDVVAFGEGENKITALAEASVERSRLSEVPGIMYRTGAGEIRHVLPDSTPVDLDRSPVPDYDDYFRDLDRLDADNQVEIVNETLPVESSRGCWWGQVHHCTFCGIDDETMRYRFKSAGRVRFLLATLQQRYGKKYFRFSDYILPRQYYKTLLPELAAQPEKFELHWEMKANVKYEDVQLMKRAGVRGVQPGIESFSSPVLKKMAKGVSGIQNVLAIKLLMQEDITVHYNILLGFPGDEPDDYRDMCERIPLLYHLFSPHSFAPVLTTRYAPMQTDPRRFGITRPIVREPLYEMVFSRKYRGQIGFDLNDFCYIFETPYETSEECSQLYSILIYQMNHWRSLLATREVRLSYEVTAGGIEFVDSRQQSEPKVTRFGANHAQVYEALSNAIVSAAELVDRFAGRFESTTISDVLTDLSRERLIYHEGPRMVGLAIPAAVYSRWAEEGRRQTQDLELQRT
jgi:ribosomal peptide maturation radical SAM protein 1